MYEFEVREVLSPKNETFKARLDFFMRLLLDVFQPAAAALKMSWRLLWVTIGLWRSALAMS